MKAGKDKDVDVVKSLATFVDKPLDHDPPDVPDAGVYGMLYRTSTTLDGQPTTALPFRGVYTLDESCLPVRLGWGGWGRAPDQTLTVAGTRVIGRSFVAPRVQARKN